jgi:hypothetical protein
MIGSLLRAALVVLFAILLSGTEESSQRGMFLARVNLFNQAPPER